jgi:hypothetical protein
MFVDSISCVKVWLATQGISLHGIFRFVIKFIVILLEFNLPSCSIGSNFVRFAPIGKVVVVSLDDDRYRGSSKEI